MNLKHKNIVFDSAHYCIFYIILSLTVLILFSQRSLYRPTEPVHSQWNILQHSGELHSKTEISVFENSTVVIVFQFSEASQVKYAHTYTGWATWKCVCFLYYFLVKTTCPIISIVMYLRGWGICGSFIWKH